jgi:hypothetical protein
MKCMSLVKGAVVALAAVGVVIPQQQLAAAQSAKALTVKSIEASVLDLSLTSDKALLGRVVDHTGTALAGAEVVVRQGDNSVTKVTTDKSGNFVVGDLKSGVYQVAAGGSVGTYRVWSEELAPPKAGEQALLVVDQSGARGKKHGWGTLTGGEAFLVGAIITSLVLGIIAIDRINDVDDAVGKIPTSP